VEKTCEPIPSRINEESVENGDKRKDFDNAVKKNKEKIQIVKR